MNRNREDQEEPTPKVCWFLVVGTIMVVVGVGLIAPTVPLSVERQTNNTTEQGLARQVSLVESVIASLNDPLWADAAFRDALCDALIHNTREARDARAFATTDDAWYGWVPTDNVKAGRVYLAMTRVSRDRTRTDERILRAVNDARFDDVQQRGPLCRALVDELNGEDDRW